MNRQRFLVCAAVALAALLAWLVAATSDEAVPAVVVLASTPVAQSSSADAAALAASKGSLAATAELAAVQADAERLWPHLKNTLPNEANNAKTRAEWRSLAAKHPDNIYIPSELRAPLSMAEQHALRQQLDDTTAMVAKQAAQKYNDRFAQAPTEPPTPLTEQKARDAGVTPEQQRNFFNYKIKELESRIQLAEFALNSNDLSADKKAAVQKELTVWKKELAELTRVQAQVPNA